MTAKTGSLSRKIVRVAVTGHRPNQVTAAQWARIEAEVDQIFSVLEEVGQREIGPQLGYVLNTALAEGADRLVTEVALRHAWRIHAILPFSEERYRRDFSDDHSKSVLARQIWAARSVSTLDGERLEREVDLDAPYAEVGRVLIDGADLLLCIWNGLPPKGPGGTAEVAALMLERGGLVMWIPVAENGVRLVGPAPLPRAGSFRRKLHEALAQRFDRAVRPAEMRIA